MRTLIVTRDGEIKLRIPAEVKNGILRRGNNLLINADLIVAPHTKESVAEAIKSHKITPEIEAMGMRIGDNGNGLVCRWADEVRAEADAKAQAEYNALPAEARESRKERQAIDLLYAAAYKSEHNDTDDNQYMRACQQRAEADRRLAAWRAKYPSDAKEERKQELLSDAAKQENLAAGAMVYDCDGSLSTADQERRRDAFLAKAAELRRQANNL